MSDAEEDLAKKYTRQLAASMQQLRDGIALRALQSWADQDELYETVEPPTDEEEIK
jgi:hypothetical protein